MPDQLVIAFAGIIFGLMVGYFFKRWNREYVTRTACAACASHRDLKIVKVVCLEIAAHVGLPVEKYKEIAS